MNTNVKWLLKQRTFTGFTLTGWFRGFSRRNDTTLFYRLQKQTTFSVTMATQRSGAEKPKTCFSYLYEPEESSNRDREGNDCRWKLHQPLFIGKPILSPSTCVNTYSYTVNQFFLQAYRRQSEKKCLRERQMSAACLFHPHQGAVLLEMHLLLKKTRERNYVIFTHHL